MTQMLLIINCPKIATQKYDAFFFVTFADAFSTKLLIHFLLSKV